MQLADYDAGGLMAIDPIHHWAVAVWDRLSTRDELADAWKAAMIGVAGAERPFNHVVGPASAMVASARRIGWSIPSPLAFIDSNGEHLDLSTVCPQIVMLKSKEALMRKEAATSSLAARIGGPPDLAPLKKFLKSRACRLSPAAASLRALGEGGWWTQKRMMASGFEGVSDPY